VGYYVPFSRINSQVDLCNRNNLGIIWGVYEPGYLRTALRYIKMGRSPKGSTFDFYFFGDYGSLAMQPVNTAGVPPTIEISISISLCKGCDLPWFYFHMGRRGADTTPFSKGSSSWRAIKTVWCCIMTQSNHNWNDCRGTGARPGSWQTLGKQHECKASSERISKRQCV
jgi:hypothetical protein